MMINQTSLERVQMLADAAWAEFITSWRVPNGLADLAATLTPRERDQVYAQFRRMQAIVDAASYEYQEYLSEQEVA